MKTLVKELSVMPQPALALKQVVLWIGANSGGVGKTTLAIHIGYEMARQGFNVALIDLDTNCAMAQFCGLRQASVANAEVSQTSAALFTSGFAGEYPLIMPEWGHPKGKLEVLLGGPFMIQVAEELAHRPRREYILMDRFQDHPLHHDLVILDCPATLGSMNTVALAAATHLLIPLSLSAKSFSGADALLTWYVNACQYLRLMPPLKATTPEVLGIVPSMYNNTEAGERAFLDQLPQMVAPLGLRVYPHVRYSAEFKNAATQGLPLQIYRPGHKGGKDFDLVCQDLAQLMREARNG